MHGHKRLLRSGKRTLLKSSAKVQKIFDICKHKSPKISTFFAELSKKGNYSATEMPNTGHRGQMSAEPIVGIKFRRNGRRKERHGMPHNERCESPIVSGINEERKILPARGMSRQEF